jgi:hypothetical protein
MLKQVQHDKGRTYRSTINKDTIPRPEILNQVQDDGEKLSATADSVWKTSGCFRNSAIPSGRLQDAFTTPRFRQEDFGMLSQRCDFVWKTSGHFRNAADKQNKINTQDNSW